ncbi:unnamed protein product, partial [Nesidiocoris tenuis]
MRHPTVSLSPIRPASQNSCTTCSIKVGSIDIKATRWPYLVSITKSRCCRPGLKNPRGTRNLHM